MRTTTWTTLAAALLALTIAGAGGAHALNPQPEPPGKARMKTYTKPNPGYPLIKSNKARKVKAARTRARQ